MPEMISVAREEWERREERLRKLAGEKSYLQLVNDLMTKLGRVTGLDNTAESIARLILESIGGSNVAVFYAIDEEFSYADAYGKKLKLTAFDDELVRAVFESCQFRQVEHDFAQTKMLTPEFTTASTWAMPLLVGPDCVGVLKMNDMLMNAQEMRRQLEPFITYAALVLKNEISGQTRLKRVNDQLREANAELKQEIQERKRVENSLRITQFAVDHASDSLFWITSDARFADVNESTCRRLGYRRDELLAMTVFDVDPAFPKEAWDAHWREVKERRSFTIQTRHRKKTGEVFPVEVSVNYAEYEGAEYNFAFARDITERTQAEAALAREREFSRALLESMADGVVACDAEGTLTLFNRTAREWHGLDPMRLPPGEWARHYDLFCDDGSTPLLAEEVPLARAFRGVLVKDAGMAILAKNQAPRFIIANGSVISDAAGTTLGAVVVMRDVTALKRAEGRLRTANEELERRVVARTADLQRVNEQLSVELEERIKIENALRMTQEELRRYQEHLEQIVRERTAELEAKNEELERMNRLFVGRELRMIELKERLRILEAGAK